MDIIANPCAGKGNGKKCLEQAKSVLDECMIQYNVHETNGAGHATKLTQEICGNCEPGNIVVALGGDGTFHEVLNGMDFGQARMGLIPAGRGNDFARGTKAASLDPRVAMSDIVRGEPRELDYIQISHKRCLNIAGTGLDVEVLLRTAKARNKISYVTSLFTCLLKFQPYDIEMVTDTGETLTTSCIMAGVCNGTQFGGDIRVSPISVPDDGKLDIIIMEKPKNKPTLFVMPGFVKGKHMNKPYAKHYVCESVKIKTEAPLELDGEIYYGLDFDAHVVKKGFKTFTSTVIS